MAIKIQEQKVIARRKNGKRTSSFSLQGNDVKDYVNGNDGWLRIRWLWLQAGYQTRLPYRVKVEMKLILGDIAIILSVEKMNEIILEDEWKGISGMEKANLRQLHFHKYQHD